MFHGCIRCGAPMPSCQHDYRPYGQARWCCKCGTLELPERPEPFLPMSYVWCYRCSRIDVYQPPDAGQPLVRPEAEPSLTEAEIVGALNRAVCGTCGHLLQEHGTLHCNVLCCSCRCWKAAADA